MRKHTRGVVATIAVTSLTLLALGLGVNSAVADMSTAKKPNDASKNVQLPESTRYTVGFDEPVSLADAVETKEYFGYPVKAYSIENPEVTGEFAANGAQTVDEFLKTFEESFGTAPMILGAVIEVPRTELDSVAQQAAHTPIVEEGAPFVADPVSPEKAEALFPEQFGSASQARSSALTRVPTGWKPEYADFSIIRDSRANTVKFSHFYMWQGGQNNLSQLQQRFGLEFQIDIQTAHPHFQVDHRPNCAQGYKEQPFAKNYDWSWTATANVGNGLKALPSTVGVYADYNDLLDECKKSSIALGMQHPQLVPSGPSGIQNVRLDIVAPRGVDDTGLFSGTVQSIDNTWCNTFPSMTLTDCMGVAPGTDGERLTANIANGWSAPNKCWRSEQQGDIPAVSYAC
ncbi:hypothetical protein [Microbacterium sp.]|jgi:hypothetical protein|uniref:hypothetical protein n=1 Tax=Microbacterium sp. TaxID=51671 RepID=UPI002852A6C6|nr:hypothetical protein [Microbacterium sp.]